MSRRRREDRGVGWAAASARAPSATAEDGQLDAVPACARGKLLLGAVDLPLRSQVAPVLAGVGVSHHHLQSAVTRDTRVSEQLVDDRSCAAQILDRLEERNRLDRVVARVEDALHDRVVLHLVVLAALLDELVLLAVEVLALGHLLHHRDGQHIVRRVVQRKARDGIHHLKNDVLVDWRRHSSVTG